MKKDIYQVKKDEVNANQFNVYKTDNIRTFSYNFVGHYSYDIFKLSVVSFLTLGFASGITEVFFVNHDNPNIANTISSVLFFLSIASLVTSVCMFVIGITCAALKLDESLEPKHVHTFTVRNSTQVSEDKLSKIINHEDMQDDFLEILDIADDLQEPELLTLLQKMTRYYDDTYERPLIEKKNYSEEINRAIAKEKADNISIKYDLLNEINTP